MSCTATRIFGLTLVYCWLSAPVQADTPSSAPSFVNDVVPILTRYGCNQGSCHGKGAGQNGFRLSLRGYAPEWDHSWITREFMGRRLSFSSPEDSLLLRKPAGQAAHEGGKLFGVGSRPYRVLLDWIRAGAPGPGKNDPLVRKLVVPPVSGMLRPGQAVQLQVQAEYSDGQVRDVAWLSRFDSNDPGIASVDVHGSVKMLRHGETSVRIAFQGQVGMVVLTSPFEQSIDPARMTQRNNFVDDHVLRKLAALHIEPSDLCDDAALLRRAFLDTIGILPTPDEVRAFLADRRGDKKARAIDALLARPEFVDHWALFLGDLLQNRKERDHDVRGTKGVRSLHDWIRRQVLENKPWDQVARAVLTAQGSTTENPAVGYYLVTVGEQQAERSEIVDSVAQAFLGTRIGCARCHNHPLERYTQDDFYHFAGFFSRIHLQRRDLKQGPSTLLVAGHDGKPNKNPVGVNQPRTGQFLKPQPLDRSTPTIQPQDDPRVPLAAWITDPGNESFSGAMVNRLWRHFLGVGLIEPVDDLRATNPPTNPELWQALNQEFVKNRFDLKHLMRVILNSRTYQLSSATRPGNEKDARFYSHYYARRLPAEVLLDAISQSTGVPDEFPGYPVGIRAGQLPDPTLKSYFLTLFGRSERVTACACERTGEVTMPQLLHLQNGDDILRKIRSPDGRLARLLQSGKSQDEIADELCLATLGRPASDSIKATVRPLLAGPADKDEVYRDLFWALLNSKEFLFNH